MSRSSSSGVQPPWYMAAADTPGETVFESYPVVAKGRPASTFASRTVRFLERQRAVSHFRLWLVQALNVLIPGMVASGFRRRLYRWAGFKGIAEGVYIMGALDLRGLRGFEQNLVIGAHAGVNSYCLFDLGGKITIGEKAHIGHNVMLLTTNHVVGPPVQRCGSFKFGNVTIGDGCWLGAGVIVLPEVSIGNGSVVSAGSVVTKSVPPNAMVAGNPARVIGWLDAGGAQPED